MIDERERFEEAFKLFDRREPAWERLVRRRERKQRNQRIAAGVLGIAVFAIAAIAFVRLLGSERGPVIGPAPSPSPAASPSPVTQPSPSFTETFDSPLHGLSIGYPSGWQTRAASEPWSHGEVTFDAPEVDVIFDPTRRDDLYLAMVSEPLDPGESETEWVSDVWVNLPSVRICRGLGGGGGDDTLQGNYGFFWACDEPHGASGSVWIVATATRGYIIYLYVGDEVPATYPVPDFSGAAVFGEAAARGEAPEVGGVRGPTGFLETLDLRPEDAVDALHPSESP
jgi:hypothetical protein